MNKKPIFSWQKDDGIAICKITNPENDYIAVGMAKCHPEDRDMMSERTGLEIAYHRALMNLYKNKTNFCCLLLLLYFLHFVLILNSLLLW